MSTWTACAHPGPPTDPLLVQGQRGKGTPFRDPSSSFSTVLAVIYMDGIYILFLFLEIYRFWE